MSRYAGISGASRYSKATLDKVYKRGLGAYYSSGSRPKVSAHQWACLLYTSPSPRDAS